MIEQQEIRSHRILSIVVKSLRYVDERLIDHGERVAFIAAAIAKRVANLSMDEDRFLLLCLLHDIGAYKTEEVSRLVSFETGNVMAHAAYGYAFIRNASGFGDCAETLLFHHTDYERLKSYHSLCATAASIIFLADRIDILFLSGNSDIPKTLRAMSGRVFAPQLVEAFFQIDEQDGLTDMLRSGAYKPIMEKRILDARFSPAEADELLNMLVYSIDFRSPYTVTHTSNTTIISVTLAQLLGMDEDAVDSVRAGAFLHDVGKISTPYSILEKADRLDADEMEIMKKHVLVSQEILQGIVPDEVRLIAVRHHEKLNGRGYPLGLSAEELTLPQRTVAVADILSALINRRSYKEPFSKDKALEIILKMRDAGELCPKVCAVLENNYDAVMEAVDQAKDTVVILYDKIKSDYAEGIKIIT